MADVRIESNLLLTRLARLSAYVKKHPEMGGALQMAHGKRKEDASGEDPYVVSLQVRPATPFSPPSPSSLCPSCASLSP